MARRPKPKGLMTVRPIPDGYHTVTPYLVVPDARVLLDFVEQAFGAVPGECSKTPDGKVMHAQVRIGSSMVMMGSNPDPAARFTTMLYLYVADCDAVYAQAIAAGGESIKAPEDQFYGDRHGGVKDPFGNQWWIATHIEDVPADEMARRAAKAMGHG